MKIKLVIKNYRCFTEANPARITIQKGFTALIGTNNSGKTTLLKFFYEFRSLLEAISHETIWESCFSGNTRDLRLSEDLSDKQDVFCNFNDRPIVIEFKFICEEKSDVHVFPKKLTIKISRDSRYSCQLETNNEIIDSKNFQYNQVDDIATFTRNNDNLVVVQISSKEFGEALKCLSQTIYIGPFRNAINIFPIDKLRVNENANLQEMLSRINTQYFDINIGSIFIKQWSECKTGNNKDLAKKCFSLQDDIRDIFGFEKLEINTSANNQTIQLRIDDEVFDLSELGSGLSQFFLILANIIMKQPSYILIDEPELNLHPSLQLDFLTTLGKYASQGVIFSTHSIGLARASAEQIYVVRKGNKNQGSEVIEFDHAKSSKYLSEFLGELSFSAYREFGFNKILLVEGVTEVKTIQQFLRKVGKDHEILLLPLGGSSFINTAFKQELEEVKRISDNIYALIDSEKISPDEALATERQGFVDLCAEIGIQCHVLDYRATENYFPDHAVKAVKGDKFSALSPYESLKDRTQFGWNKADNWRMAKAMTLEELQNTDLGKFINHLID